MEWDSKYKIGHKKIDQQHKTLVRKLNELVELSKKNENNSDSFKIALELLESYCLLHFSTEENIMIKAKYPALKKHKEQHENFIEALLMFKNEYIKKGMTNKLIKEIDEYCTCWILGHTTGEDQRIQDFLVNI